MQRASFLNTLTWGSRHHRKGLVLREIQEGEALAKLRLSRLFLPQHLNWWIGILFAIGAGLFACGSALSLNPGLASVASLSKSQVGMVFFAGSIPFTMAAYLQLWQAANAGNIPGEASAPLARKNWFGWRPKDIGWLSCALQFVGTVFFNINTFDAMLPALTWIEEDVTVWIPNFLGSVAFLVSGYLAFIEVCRRHWAWQPRSVSWWLVFANLLGCVAFMVSALTAMTLPNDNNSTLLTVSLVGTLTGAVLFFVGALLSLVETAQLGASSESTNFS